MMISLPVKYRPIVITSGIFLAVYAIIAGMAIMAARDARQYTDLTTQLSDVRVLNQRVDRSVSRLRYAIANGEGAEAIYVELKADYQLLDETLTVIRESVRDDDSFEETTKLALADMVTVWNGFERVLIPVVSLPKPIEDGWFYRSVVEADTFVSANARSLASEQSRLTWSAVAASTKYYFQLTVILWLAVVIALMQFLIMIGIHLRKLEGLDRQEKRGHAKINAIVEHLDEAVLVVDWNLIISEVHTVHARNVLGTSLEGRSLVELLEASVSESQFSQLKKYLNMLRGRKASTQLLSDLNPLKRIPFKLSESTKDKSPQVVTVDFKSVFERDNTRFLLVHIKDVSEECRLDSEVALLKEQQGESLERVIQLLNYEPREVYELVVRSLKRLRGINQRMKGTGASEDFVESGRYIARELHRIKGDTSMYELHDVAKIAHEAETELKELFTDDGQSGDQYLPLTVKLKRMNLILQDYQQLTSRIKELSTHHYTGASSGLNLAHHLQILAQKIAEPNDKKVQVIYAERGTETLDSDLVEPIRDILIQLVRNAVAHGIEPFRERGDKQERGRISVNVVNDGSSTQLCVIDDGRGLDVSEIRRIAIERGFIDQEERQQLTAEQVYLLLLEPGFTSKTNADENSGRGIGMNLVRELVAAHQGNVSIRQEFGRFFRITVTLPHLKRASGRAASSTYASAV